MKPENKAIYVQEMFNKIAPKYDLMNDLMTAGMHRFWKKKIVQMLNLKPSQKVLDLCCGTGDLTFYLAQKAPEAKIIGLDFSAEMLKIAQAERKLNNIEFIEGDALNLPFESESFDKAIISFGLRNVADYEKCLMEIWRICKKGGQLIILDLSHPQGFWDIASQFYRFKLLPFLGGLLAKNASAYDYLPNSIQNYPDQLALKALMQKTNWQKTNYQNILGGVLSIHEGFKV